MKKNNEKKQKRERKEKGERMKEEGEEEERGREGMDQKGKWNYESEEKRGFVFFHCDKLKN